MEFSEWKDILHTVGAVWVQIDEESVFRQWNLVYRPTVVKDAYVKRYTEGLQRYV